LDLALLLLLLLLQYRRNTATDCSTSNTVL